MLKFYSSKYETNMVILVKVIMTMLKGSCVKPDVTASFISY